MVHGAFARVTTSRRSTVMAPSAAVSAMLRGLLLLATLPLAAAKGAGAWLDPTILAWLQQPDATEEQLQLPSLYAAHGLQGSGAEGVSP